MHVDSHLYRKAFQAYLRKGTPIEWSIKEERPTTHYIWRTRGDDKVRPSHAANNGRVFAWNDPPETGHPGEDYGCRCTAEPYMPSVNEHIEIEVSNVSDTGAAWSSQDFVDHYYNGSGRGVTVRETGHLSNIVARYMNTVRKSLQDNIARVARRHPNGAFSDDFVNIYNMTWIVFSIGDTTIGGRFMGNCVAEFGILTVSGQFDFYLEDEFVNPADVGLEVIDLGETIYENIHRPLDDYLRGRPSVRQRLGIHTGEPYAITDQWGGSFSGRIYADAARSDFG
ncbi:MAG: minor capsid protein [Pseudomonadota bacterium]